MKQFLNPTRARIISSLRGGERTVNDLVAEVGLTDNAIRSHLEALERQGLVCRSGFRSGTRKPHHAYKLTTKAGRIFFEACEPLLSELVAVASTSLMPQKFKDMLREVGRRLASTQGMPAGRSSKKERIGHALAALEELGGKAVLEQNNGKLAIRSGACPWAIIVARHPEVCLVAEAFLSQVIGAPIKEHCMRGESPRCYFEIK